MRFHHGAAFSGPPEVCAVGARSGGVVGADDSSVEVHMRQPGRLRQRRNTHHAPEHGNGSRTVRSRHVESNTGVSGDGVLVESRTPPQQAQQARAVFDIEVGMVDGMPDGCIEEPMPCAENPAPVGTCVVQLPSDAGSEVGVVELAAPAQNELRARFPVHRCGRASHEQPEFVSRPSASRIRCGPAARRLPPDCCGRWFAEDPGSSWGACRRRPRCTWCTATG